MELPLREDEDNDVYLIIRKKGKKPTKALNNNVDLGRFSKSHVVSPGENVQESEEYPTTLTRNELRTMRYKSAPDLQRRLVSNEEAQRKVLERMKQYSSRRKQYRRSRRTNREKKPEATAPKTTTSRRRSPSHKTSRPKEKEFTLDSLMENDQYNGNGKATRRRSAEPEFTLESLMENDNFEDNKRSPPPTRSQKRLDKRNMRLESKFHSSCPTFNTPSMGMLAVGRTSKRSLRSEPIASSRAKNFNHDAVDKPKRASPKHVERSKRCIPPRSPEYIQKSKVLPPSPKHVAEHDDSNTVHSFEVPSVVFAGCEMSVVSELEFDAPSRREKKRAVTKIQAFWRMVLARDEFREKIDAAITIQTLARGFSGHRWYMRELADDVVRLQWYAAAVIQSAVRGMLTRNKLLEYHASRVERTKGRDSGEFSLNFRRASIVTTLYEEEEQRGSFRKRRHSRRESRSPGSPSRSTETLETAKSTVSGNARGELIENAEYDDTDGDSDRSRLHAKLTAYELSRQKDFEPKLTSSCSQWHASVEALQSCVRDLACAERLIYELLAENQARTNDGNDTNEKGYSIWGAKKPQDESSDQMDGGAIKACRDIADEVSEMHEEMQTQVNTFCEVGDTIVADLGSSEMGIVQAWDSYASTATEANKRLAGTGAAPLHASPVSENVADVWLLEMRYRIAVSFQSLAWRKASKELSNIFESATKTEYKHRSRLYKLLSAFESQWQQHVSTLDSGPALDTESDECHAQIEELIQNLTAHTRRRPSIVKSLSCLSLGNHKEQMLESPMASSLMCASKVIEKRTKGSVGLRTYWNQSLAVATVDGYMHLFDRPSSSEEVKNPKDFFLDLVQAEYDDAPAIGDVGHLTPTESLFLPNCVVEVNAKDSRSFDITEDSVGKTGKSFNRRMVFRTDSTEETTSWVQILWGTQSQSRHEEWH